MSVLSASWSTIDCYSPTQGLSKVLILIQCSCPVSCSSVALMSSLFMLLAAASPAVVPVERRSLLAEGSIPGSVLN